MFDAPERVAKRYRSNPQDLPAGTNVVVAVGIDAGLDAGLWISLFTDTLVVTTKDVSTKGASLH
jgi:hypothetical protein